ncbi:MAG: cation:proton antiporter [Deltaproteobacteria bacterium]|nr:cation:proton antiporter [Deltaproteobacteria bacterium]
MQHLAPLIRDLAVILGVAAVVTLIFQRIRQPVVLGYIIAGFICGPYVLRHPLVSDSADIKVWAELGVIFLMFSLGLEFSFRKLAKVGISSAVTAGYEVFMMMALGFTTGRLLGWSRIDSTFLAAMMSISSTTIIIKALDELRLKSRRFAEMIFGVLVVEDLIAILILVALSTMAVSGSFKGVDIMLAGAKLLLVIGSWFLAGYFVLPRFVRYVGKLGNDEMLTIVSLGLCLSLSVVAARLNYSVALGAFIMGSILAESTESFRIEELIRPLRDLFAAIFFVSVGMLIDPHVLIGRYREIGVITLVLVAGKIINITAGALVSGQTLRTSLQVGFGMAQIGEFSFIIATLGLTLGVTSDFLYPVAVAVSLITAFTTPYLIRVSHKFAVFLEGKLPLRAKHVLSQYASWTQERSADSRRRGDFYKRAFKWLLNGILVTVSFVLVAERVLPALSSRLGMELSPGLEWLVAVACGSPFLWAMFSAFRGFRLGRGDYRSGGVLFLSRLLTVFWVGAMTLEFFDAEFVLLLTGLFGVLLFVSFHRQLGSSYRWFEERFLATFDDASKSKKPTDIFRHLAPWDAHLVRFKVHPNSDLAGRKLGEIDLRARFGLNIVVIQRGLRTIVAPQPGEVIYPKDELLVLGTDEEVETARKEIEKPPGLAERFRHISGYELRHILITEDSPLKELAIRESGIRERFGGMVVGLERGEDRMINPNSNSVLKLGDVLWIVGETDKIQKLR